MIGKKVQDGFNAQIGEEMESAYLYLAMAAYFESTGFEGMAQWMKAQTIEEMMHAMRFFNHIVARAGRVQLPALKQPKAAWASPLDAFKAAYGHEQHITAKINELVDLSTGEKDHAAGAMLQWFVTEQVEEEEQTLKVADLLEKIGDSGNGLIMLDRQLGARPLPVTVPAAGA
ncbi:MAG: ferritin [Candidatus Eisenbacteria bacterium]